MPLIDLFRNVAPWEIRRAEPGTLQDDALGGFRAEEDARWVCTARDAGAAVLGLYAAVKAVETRIAAGKAPLVAQRRALIAALREFER